jgi:hypothetical protein
MGDLVTSWHVSDEISLPDHRHIVFQVGDLEITRFTYRNLKRPNWESYQEGLKVNLWVVPRVINSVVDVELAVDILQQDILSTCSPKLSSLGGSLAKGGSLVVQRVEPPYNCNKMAFNQVKMTGDWE